MTRAQTRGPTVPESKRGKRRRGSQTSAQRRRQPRRRRRPDRSGSSNVNSSIPGLPWLVGGGDRPGRPRRRPAPARSRSAAAAAERGRPSAQRPAPRRIGAAAERVVPDQPAAAAAGRPDPDRDDPDRQGRDGPQDRGRPVADRGRQLRRARLVRLLRRQPVPSAPTSGRHPSSSRAATPDGTARRPGLHDPGRAGDRRPTSAASSRWPARRNRTRVGSQFFIVLSTRTMRCLLKAYNTYQIIGNVTSGMETADAIASVGRRGAARPTRSS